MDISTCLTKLFHALPPRKGNLSELADSYKLALHKATAEGLAKTVGKYICGEVEGMAMTYAPTPPELAKAVRDTDRALSISRQPRLDYEPEPFTSIDFKLDALRHRLVTEGRRKLCDCPTLQMAQEIAKRGDVPPGSLYVGMLGAFYSQPEGQDYAR